MNCELRILNFGIGGYTTYSSSRSGRRVRVRSLFLSLTVAITATAQQTTDEKEKADSLKKDSLPADAIIVKRVPLASGPEFSATDVLVVDTIPSSSEGLNIVLYNDNTWRFVRNRNVPSTLVVVLSSI